MDLYIKGEPPISEKFNRFTKSFAQDINIASKQVDYLSANLISAFNMFTAEVEQENAFINRIKNKTKILQMYSSAPANDLFYFGGSFDSNDYINYSKIENNNLAPLIENGAMTLPVVTTKNWTPRRVTIDELNSNGVEGNNHAVYSKQEGDGQVYRYFFMDVQDSRNKNNIIDNNPLKFYEYEQINIPSKNPQSQDFEFKYLTENPGNSAVQARDWSTFTNDPLKLALEFDSETAQKANFVKISPYFGNANYISKDIIVRKIEVTNKINEVEDILNGQPIYISSSFIPSSIDASRNFYYREANIKFLERDVKKFKIFFEQIDSTPVVVQHLYFAPETASTTPDNPYRNQLRFNPFAPSVTSNRFTDIPWSSNIGFNINTIIPKISNPNQFKKDAGSLANTISVPVRLERQIPRSSGKTIKFSIPNQPDRFISGTFFNNFDATTAPKILPAYSGISNPSQWITATRPDTSNINSGFIAETEQGQSILQDILTWFGNSVQASPAEKLTKFNLPTGTTISIIDINSSDTIGETLQRPISLVRRYEQYNAQRRSISLRDVSFGYEEYADTAMMISRQFDLSSEIEYMTMSSEVAFSGNINRDQQDLIRYSISVDGINWKRISPIENPFYGIPEVLAFNLNIDQTFRLPGVEYFNQPQVPSSIKSFSMKIELFKPSGQNITPMVYSYKVGAKVRQL